MIAARGVRLFLACAVAVCVPAAAAAAQALPTERQSRAVATDATITVDGALSEPAWSLAAPVGEFLQRDPREGERSTESTEVRILYTRRSVFFAIRCNDAEAARILATELRRDNEFSNDDAVSILLDTLHDKRSAYLFRVNPRGTQYDALVTDEGRVTDANWDESWNSAARITEQGWTAEIEIPFKILRLTDRTDQVWGVDFERIIRRKNEFTYWSNYQRGFSFTQVSRAGTLTGLRDISTGLTVRIKPFVKSAVNHASALSRTRPHTVNVSDIGLEDVKYRVTPNFTADFTVNTDFAETDVDAQVLNLTRFPVYFPEKREFFVEGAGIFDYGPGGGQGSEIRMFFSRRIGLSDDRETIPILAGSKLTGKAGTWTVGAINVQTGEFGRTPSRNFTVARIKKDILARSNIGFITTNRSSGKTGDPYNRAFGGDVNLILLDHLYVQSFLMSTWSPGSTSDRWAGRYRGYWDSDLIFLEGEDLLIQRDVNPEMGWLPRKDMRKRHVKFDVKPRPGIPSIRQLFFRSNLDYITNQAGQLETRHQDLVFESLFESGDRLVTSYNTVFDVIRTPFSLQRGIVVPAGNYNWQQVQGRFTPSSNRSLSGEVNVRRQWGFYGGDNLEVSWSPLWKPSANLSLAPSYQFTKVSVPQGRFTSHLVNSQINYAFSTRWLTSTTLQYNNLARIAVTNFRLNYIYRPGDDLFVIFNESRTLENGLIIGQTNRSFIVKLTRSWDF